MSALGLALALVNTATPRRLVAAELHAALRNPACPGQAQARVLLEEAPRAVLLGLVQEGWITFPELARAARAMPHLGGRNGPWIEEMAGFAVAGVAGPGDRADR